jgi:hypothetical protein
MIAFYAANGMAEILYLFLLVGGIYAFLRWYLTRSTGALIFTALFLSLGILTRYEVFTWAAVLTVALTLIGIRQRITRSELEGTLLTYLAPISYGLGLWLFFNWLILGSPVFFLQQQTPGAPLTPGASATPVVHTSLSPVAVAGNIVSLNWHLFPPVVLVFLALVAVLVVRRDVMTATLISMLVLNAAFTWLIVVASGAEAYLQLRYNMRAMPIAVTAMAWLYLIARGRRRTAVWGASLVAILASAPFTLQTMRSFAYQFREVDFVHAIEGKGGLPDQLAEDRRVARWIDANVDGRDAILTDDSQTFGTMLMTGRPGVFWDRIDRGDAAWFIARDHPWGRVRYLLAVNGGPDLVSQRYPALNRRRVPGLTPVFRTTKYTVVEVAQAAPSRLRTR